MTVEGVTNKINAISKGLEGCVIDCMERNSVALRSMILEQLYSGISGNDQYLNPNYDNDPFFQEEGPWYRRNEDYKAWKNMITPPIVSRNLHLPARPSNVPNLYINGKFYSEIEIFRSGNKMEVKPSDAGDGPEIVRKWGELILTPGSTAKQYFITNYLNEAIKKLMEEA